MYSLSNFMIIGTNSFIFKEQSISIFFLDYFMNNLLLKLSFYTIVFKQVVYKINKNLYRSYSIELFLISLCAENTVSIK